ncbi:MAG: RagB/SusD family nutrient uptake outer membrane protein [Bacteroidota bacterium]
MRKTLIYIHIGLFLLGGVLVSCTENFLTLTPRGTELETAFYQNEEEIFEGLVAAYDVLQWGGTNGWTMTLGLLNAASDDTYAGGSDASDQPNWVAYDNFTLDPFLGPQLGLWQKYYSGIYRANLVLQKLDELPDDTEIGTGFIERTRAEAKFLRAFFYFDLVRFFGNVPLITAPLGADEIYTQIQADPVDVYAQIEQDLNDARNSFDLPETVSGPELGRITSWAATALLGKVILYQNDESRMGEAAEVFEAVIGSGRFQLEPNFEDVFKTANEFGMESIFEINYSSNQRGGWPNFGNGTEGNYNVQFFGMRDYVGPTFATGWSFCPVTPKLVDAMQNDPRFEHTIIDGAELKNRGASYAEGYQNTDYFIRKYAGLSDERALDGEPALNWTNNIREIRYADVLLMAAEAYARAGNDSKAREYLNEVRTRVALPANTADAGSALLDAIYKERQLELATEGHRFFDLVRTGRAVEELGDQGFVAGKNELLPIPQTEIDVTEGNLNQNPGY